MPKPKEDKKDKAIDDALLTAVKVIASQPKTPASISGSNHSDTNTKQEEVGIFVPGQQEPNDGGVITNGKPLDFTKLTFMLFAPDLKHILQSNSTKTLSAN
jgi:hypothetical protein